MKQILKTLKESILGSSIMFLWAAFAFLSTAFFISLWIKVITLMVEWL
jgi:hypothetical protein